MPSNTAAIYVT